MTAIADIAASRRGIFETDEIRIEGRLKVTGAAQYTGDFTHPDMLWAAFATSDLAHARIASIDTSAAFAVPGVKAVLTGADIGRNFGRVLADWPILARDRVRFIGEYVAAVAAETREAAREAAAAIVVVYEEIEALFDPEEAIAPGAPALHESPETYAFHFGKRAPVPHHNVQGVEVTEKGDVDAALAGAARIFEHTFTTPRHLGGSLEPRSTLVWIDAAGIVHVLTTNKAAVLLRIQMAAAFELPPESIVIEVSYIGGDFGAKGLSIDEFVCYYLAKATGRPIKATCSFVDDVRSTNTRHASKITFTTGVDEAGRIVGMRGRVLFNGGAYAAAKPIPTLVPGFMAKAPYAVANCRFELSSVYTNAIPAGHLRCPGDVQIVFALESHIDMIATALGIDPLEFRLLNAIGEGASDFTGQQYLNPRGIEVLEALRKHANWSQPLKPGRGRGMSFSARHIGHGIAHVRAILRPDGNIEILTMMSDVGVGALTLMQRVLAEALHLPLHRISARRATTADGLLDFGPGASRVTHVTGRAVLDAAQKLEAHMHSSGWTGGEASWESTARTVTESGDFAVTGIFNGNPAVGEPEYVSFSAFMAEVTVDPETGQVTINDSVFVADVGTVINPIAHRGQIDGGFIWGFGHAMMEELIVEDGRIMNMSLADYKMTTIRDVPPFRVVELPGGGGPGPFGSKMVGEYSTQVVPPAIANAVAAACGARILTMPITPERVLNAIDASR